MLRKQPAIIMLAITLAACSFLQTVGSSSSRPVPANISELCQIVGLNPETDTACQKHTGSLMAVLETAFPPKVATMERVHERLSPYLVSSWPTLDGSYESYAIVPGLLGPVLGQFGYDKSGTLIAITI